MTSKLSSTKTGAGAAAAAAADPEKSSPVLDQVEQHYFAEARKGLILTASELRDFCVEKGLKPCPTEKQLQELRHRWKYIGMHSRWKKPPQYVGSSIDKLGNIFVDVAEFKKNLVVANKQRYILLVATDLLSQKIACIAFPNKSQASWERGIAQMILQDFPAVKTIVTDRDTSISGAAFQARIKSKYGVDWIHLRNR